MQRIFFSNHTNRVNFESLCALCVLIVSACWSTSVCAQATTAAPEYTVTVSDAATPATPTIELPDVAKYDRASVEAIAAQLPQEHNGKATLATTDGEKCLSECFGGKLRKGFEAMQGTAETRVIKLQGGNITLEEVVSQVADSAAASMEGDTLTLGLPLLVGPDATLVIKGAKLKLLTERGVFLANQGTLILLDTEISSWDAGTQKPTTSSEDGKSFRPFVTSYAGSKMYLAGCKLNYLGYLSPSAYGCSLTSHPQRNTPESDGAWPTGTIVDCTFEGLYYGFYSFEARDVAIVNNKYVDSIRYGIDPHDRSTRLTIAKNSVTGTKEKHGIIASRNVTDSFIFDNDSRTNAGTGIMLDRQCSNIVIANNRVVDNLDTGIAAFESRDNQVVNNLIAFNAGNGFRVRNCQELLLQDNIVVGNEGFAVMCEAKTLGDHQKRTDRGDTYQPGIDMSVYSNAMVANLDGLFKGRNITSLKISNIIADVDMSVVQAQVGGEKRVLDMEDDDPLGGDIEDYLREFDSVTDSTEHILEISGK